MNGCQDSIPYASSCNLKMSKAETFRGGGGGILHFGGLYDCSFISYCLWLTINFCSTEIVLASTFLILVILMFLAWVSYYSEDGDGESHHLSFTFRLFLHLFFSSTQTFWYSLQNNENKHCWESQARKTIYQLSSDSSPGHCVSESFKSFLFLSQ